MKSASTNRSKSITGRRRRSKPKPRIKLDLHGLTTREIAAKSRLDPSYVWRILSGERHPSGSVLRRLADALGLSMDELYRQLP